MCEPVTMILGALSVAGAAAGLGAASKMKVQQPPAAKLPEKEAIGAPVNRDPAAVVRLGSGKDNATSDPLATLEPETLGRAKATSRRSGSTLGNLGRSSLI